MKILSMVFFLSVQFLCLTAQEIDSLLETYNLRIQQTHIKGIYIPADPNDAMKQLDTLIESESSKEKFKALSEEDAETKLHFSFGQWMMVNWGLYEGSRLSHWFKQCGVSYPDDMAKILMIAYHRTLNGKEPGFDNLCELFKEKRKREWHEKLQENIIGKIDTTQVLPKPGKS